MVEFSDVAIDLKDHCLEDTDILNSAFEELTKSKVTDRVRVGDGLQLMRSLWGSM